MFLQLDGFVINNERGWVFNKRHIAWWHRYDQMVRQKAGRNENYSILTVVQERKEKDNENSVWTSARSKFMKVNVICYIYKKKHQVCWIHLWTFIWFVCVGVYSNSSTHCFESLSPSTVVLDNYCYFSLNKLGKEKQDKL